MGSRDTELLHRLTDAAGPVDTPAHATQRVSVVLHVEGDCSIVTAGSHTRSLARRASCAL